ILLFVLGLALTVKGGDYFVDAASWMAEVSGIPKFIVGATIVSIATTMPEMIVSVMAALEGKVDMGIGNAVGSVIANTALIMGVAIVCLPFVINRKQYVFKMYLLLAAAAVLPLLCRSGQLTLGGAAIMLLIFIVFIVENVRAAKRQKSTEPRPAISRNMLTANIIKFVLGTVGIVLGARLMVDNGSNIARIVGVPESVIGLTIIAVGTSLPELVTMIVSVRKRQVSLSVGNIIGANIIDLASILPVCAFVSGGALPVATSSILIDMPFCLLVIAIIMLPTIITGRFQRWQGFTTILLYFTYIINVAF
ncbi:MAG: calcium/sodium antiporter, partial [Angelakisella sp.]